MHKLHSIQVYINTPKNCKGKIDKKSAENSQKIRNNNEKKRRHLCRRLSCYQKSSFFI